VGKAGVQHGGQTDNLSNACLAKMQKGVFGMQMYDMQALNRRKYLTTKTSLRAVEVRVPKILLNDRVISVAKVREKSY